MKVSERLSFPLIVNLNTYMQGYEGIQTKLYDQEVELVTKLQKGQVEKNLKSDEVK